jgi:arylsulfatase
MTPFALAMRCLAAAFCLGALEAVLLYRLHYVQDHPFVHLEILNVAAVYAATLGVGLFLAGAAARRLRVDPAFPAAAGIAAVPVALALRHEKHLRSFDFDAGSSGIGARILGVGFALVATILLGLLFRRRPAAERIATGLLGAVTAGVLLWNVARPPGLRAAPLEIVEEARNPVNVIWVTSDALRAANTSIHGYWRETTPVLEKFRKDSVFFRDNYSQCCWTQPSMTSLFTSLYPFEAFRTEGGLSPELFTIAQVLREAGWRTAGLSNNEVVGPSTSLDRGFDVFFRPPRAYARDRLLSYTTLAYVVDGMVGGRIHAAVEAATFVPQPRRQLAARTENALFEEAVRVLDELEEPFFLYLHFMAPHAPYAPEEAFADWSGPGPPPTEHLLRDARKMPPKDLAPEELADVVLRYDREIRMVDDYFGALLERLREKGLYDDSIVIFTSDHGEELLEHGEWTHGRALYEESVHVPLLIKLPASRHGGVTFDLPTQGVDLLPTILAVVDLEAAFPYALRGEAIFGPGGETIRDLGSRPIVIEFNSHYPDVSDQAAIVLGNLKLVRNLASGEVELYDLAADPAERRNVATTDVERRDRLAALLDAILREHQGGFYARAPSPLETMRVQEELRALGYIQ